MTHIIQAKPGQPTPTATVPWGKKKDLRDAGLLERAYETCQRGDKSHCINTNLIRAFAELQDRTIRYPHTFKGSFHWSELVEGRWCAFVAPLSLAYVRVIDAFDHDGKHFRMPTKCPMGPVRFVGFCLERRDQPTIVRDRRDRLNARISDGKLVPGARFRERQTPYVEERLAAEPARQRFQGR